MYAKDPFFERPDDLLLVEGQSLAGIPLVQFNDDDQAVAALIAEGKHCAAVGSYCRVAFFDGPFNILGMVIRSIDDDRVVDAPGHKELVTVEKPQITSPKEFPIYSGQNRP